MNNKITFPKLATLLADKSGRSKRFSEDFIREFFALISETLEEGDTVKIKGFGSFRLSRVEPRMSVDVTTGQPIEISGHTKVVFAPSKELGETINAPFEAFSPLEIDENFDLSKFEEDTPSEEETMTVATPSDTAEATVPASTEIPSDAMPEVADNILQKEPIILMEDSVEIDASLREPETDEDNVEAEVENIIDFTSADEKVNDPTVDRSSSDIPVSEVDTQVETRTEEIPAADVAAEYEDDAEELDESIHADKPSHHTDETPQPEEIEEETESFVISTKVEDPDREATENAEPIEEDEDLKEVAGDNDETDDDEHEDLNEQQDSEEDDLQTTPSETLQFGLIQQTSEDSDEEEDADEAPEVEELMPDSYDEDETLMEEPGTKRRQWLKGFMVGIAAAVGAILITFLIWYFYTSPSFKEKELPREKPNLFSKNEPVSSEAIPITEPEPETESVAIVDEEISDPDEGKTDTEVAKAVATAASDAVIYDKITTTRYLITMAKEHYGNMNFWPYIYEENKNNLGDPDRIRPGTSVVIPPLSKYGVDPKNPKDIEKAKLLGKEIYARYRK